MSTVAQPSLSGLLGRKEMPALIGSEAAECGLVCLAMVMASFGSPVDLATLRKRYPTSLSGMTLRGLVEVSTDLGFSARAYRAEIGQLSQVRLPAILHWNFNHFVVLAKLGRRSATIHDPNGGRRVVSFEELSSRFTGVVLELRPERKIERLGPTGRVTLKSLWAGQERTNLTIAQILTTSALISIAGFLAPLQIQLAVDGSSAGGAVSTIFVIAAAFATLALIHFGLEYTRSWITQYFGSLLSYNSGRAVVNHLLALPINFFEKRRVGDIAARIRGVSQINEIVLGGAISVVIDGVVGIAALIALLFYAAPIAVISLLSIAASATVAAVSQPNINRLTERSISQGGIEQSVIIETIRSMLPLKMNSREMEREIVWSHQYAETVSANYRLSRARSTQSQILTLLSNLTHVVTILVGAIAISSGSITLGMFMAALFYQNMAGDRILGLISTFSQIQTVRVMLDRLGDIIGTEAEGDTNPTRVSAQSVRIRGSLQLDNVFYRYGSTSSDALIGATLNIAEGDFVAIVGPSGSGKSTLLKVMLGLYAPTSGAITLDGMVADSSLWRAWRKTVGLVSQEDQLLAGTIADNINFFAPDADDAKTHAAANMAQIHREIVAMPMGYHTMIGEMGAALSSGQKQRILLARAFYNDPTVLILDEGTANLDAENEGRIVDIVSSLRMTRIVVSHRPALVEKADRVIRIDRGIISEVDSGTRSKAAR